MIFPQKKTAEHLLKLILMSVIFLFFYSLMPHPICDLGHKFFRLKYKHMLLMHLHFP